MYRIKHYVDKHRTLIEDAFRYIWTHPETGYREWQTHAYLAEQFRKLGYELTEAGDIPGFYTDLDTGRPGPTLLIMGELDALICPNHPENVNGNAHACGHAAQCAALLGLAAALKEKGAVDKLSGKIRLMAVPAEELIEIDYREGLRKEGKIHSFGGKVEFMYRGFMDDVDLAMMIHTSSADRPHTGDVNAGCNGMITFSAIFHGQASHAGGSPDQGINALYAATQALSACNAVRETFPDEETIRFHPIMTEGGASVNIIPAQTRIESYVRGQHMKAILEANRRLKRAAAGSAASIGAGLTIINRPGYHPAKYDEGMMLAMKEAMEDVLEEVYYRPDFYGRGSTDNGDLSAVMPIIHPHIGGAEGHSHGDDYRIVSVDSACVDSAKVQASFVEILLGRGAERAEQIVADFRPQFPSIRAYFEFMDSLVKDIEAVEYCEDGTIRLTLE